MQTVPYRINPRRNIWLRHILIKLTKMKHKERILKTAREKQKVTYKGNPIELTADLSAERSSRRSPVGCHFLLQGIFPTQGLNPGLPHCRQALYHLSHKGSPYLKYWKGNSTTKITVANKDLIQNWWRNKKFFRQAKVKRIQYHQTSFTTNVKGTYISIRNTREEKDLHNQTPNN